MSADASPPALATTTVGSYAPIHWLLAQPSEESLVDATALVFYTQRRLGIDLPTDGELYRYDPDHPETNGMIDYFVSRLGGIATAFTRTQLEAFRKNPAMGFRRKPAGLVREAISEGQLNLPEACARSAAVSGGSFKFTLTSPYMLARTLVDEHYGDFGELTMAIAEVLANQVAALDVACLQVDEANLPGNPEHAEIALAAVNKVLSAFPGERAVHLCFGNYGGQTIQSGTWDRLLAFLNGLEAHHLVLELARRPEADHAALAQIEPPIALGVGVIDIKTNEVETPATVARRIETAARHAGPDRVKWVHPDCGLWMLHRSVAERKLAALVAGRDLYLGS